MVPGGRTLKMQENCYTGEQLNRLKNDHINKYKRESKKNFSCSSFAFCCTFI